MERLLGIILVLLHQVDQDCGFNEAPPSRVRGGEDTQPGEYPYTALIGSTNTDGQVQWKCGGTLINYWYVVTAAHCQGSNTSRITKVRLGEWSVKDELDCWKPRGKPQSCLEPAQDFDIGTDGVTVHENYTMPTRFANDIALVRLDRAARMGRGVAMICLPADLKLAARQLNVANMDPNSGLRNKYGVVAGWGYTDYKPYLEGPQGDISKYAVATNTLQKLELPILSAEDCRDKFRGRFTPKETQICAGGEKGKDSCKGDSGGPLYFKTIAGQGNRSSDENLEPVYLIGIVSFGSKDCNNGSPGIYTSVKEYVPWIKQVIEQVIT